MHVESWIGENEFRGYGISKHGTDSRPETYKYSFTGQVEPVGVILLTYRAEGYPVAGNKNVGIAILQIKNEHKLTGIWYGFQDKRSNSRKCRDSLTHPEKLVENDKFLIPFGSMTQTTGPVKMIRSGKGADGFESR